MGIQTSILMSESGTGAMSAATRQKGGRSLKDWPGPGNAPASTCFAIEMVVEGTLSELRVSQVAAAASGAHAKTRHARLNMRTAYRNAKCETELRKKPAGCTSLLSSGSRQGWECRRSGKKPFGGFIDGTTRAFGPGPGIPNRSRKGGIRREDAIPTHQGRFQLYRNDRSENPVP